MNFEWDICYKRAIQRDGTALFPEKLPLEFLNAQRKVQGSYVFANQYQNEIIPLEDQTFKEEWKKYYQALPSQVYSFAFVDPAISEADTADFTAIVVVSVDVDKNWYVRQATRLKCNPSVTIDYLFRLQEQYTCMSIGIEDVAYQKALIHFSYEEMKRRGKMLPVTGVKHGPDRTKEMRILGLVPRFEFNTLFLNQGLHDLELELAQFPRSAHDDLLDALASINDIVYYPAARRVRDEKPHPQDPAYESWVIRNAHRGSSEE
jgi:predicted phage terminase large subunit-like protein